MAVVERRPARVFLLLSTTGHLSLFPFPVPVPWISSHKVKVFPLFIHRGIYDGSLVVLITQIKLTKVSQVKFNPCLSPEMKVISLCERGFCMSDITSK